MTTFAIPTEMAPVVAGPPQGQWTFRLLVGDLFAGAPDTEY